MKIFTMCMECQKELGHPSFEPIITDYYEEALAFIECSRGHKSAVLLQSQKFEILLESAANALIEGYTLEAASSLSSAYERFFEFAINVFCKKNKIPKKSIDETFKQVAKQSERQIGAFLFLHLLIFGRHYTLNKKIPELRNKVIHQGYIPTPNEVIDLGELIYQEILAITNLLSSELLNELQQVTMETVQGRNEKIPTDIPRATTTGTIFFSLGTTNRKETFQEALSSYTESREKLYGSMPYLRFFSKAVEIYAKLKKNI
ncbi:hypothetical protein [Chromobacterium vaccinii]|uniref:hypothetical protein n=1 Tax=Chromobacterium vaccinii TaxID=1108595 RepID=UPI000B2C6E7D|nr:hypothetical protein [Chromobacterium vaccinii]